MKKLERFLFKNIGKTLKRYAVASFIVETIAGIISAIVMIDGTDGLSLLLIPAAPFVAYTLSIFLYGFGELVDSTATTAKASSDSNQIFDTDELPEL